MSIAEMRQEIADCLNSIDGVTAYLYRPTAPKAGSAWIEGPSLTREPGSWWEFTWEIKIYVGQQSVQAADTWFEENIDALADGLSVLGGVRSIEQTNLGSDLEPEFGLIITLECG